MPLFFSAAAAQGDPVALAMVLALAAAVAVMAFRKRLARRKQAARPAPAAPAVPAAAAKSPAAPGSAGRLKLHNVPPKTAAMLMAIVADRLGKPLNELRFISIKEVTENEV